jgi:hypothetical protein
MMGHRMGMGDQIVDWNAAFLVLMANPCRNKR